MKQTSERIHLLRFAIIGLVFLIFLAGFSFYQYDRIRRQSALAMRQKLVGTWVGQEGNIVAFHLDGTARVRILETKVVRFWEWTVSAKELKFFLGKGSYVQGFKRYVLGESYQSMEILEASDDKLVLFDRSSGQRTVLMQTQNAILDEAK